MKKGIKALIFFMITLIFILTLNIGSSGYLKYKDVVHNIGIEEKILEIRNSDDYIKINHIDTNFLNAIVAIEDHRFYEHDGLDFVGITRAIVSNIREGKIVQGEQRISIPLGNLTGLKLLSGKGPKIKVEVLPVRSVVAEVSSAFSESGINQSWHKIILNVKTNFGVMVLSRSISCNVSDSIVLADTVIVGNVPDAYTDINKIEDEELGDVVDFAASSN
jgi:sporulation protein YunB